MRSLPEVDRYDFHNELLRGLYTEFPEGDRAALAVRSEAAAEELEALELEALSYATVRQPRGGRMFCYAPESMEEMDGTRLKAYRRVIESLRPDWAERVRFATLMDNDTYTIVHLSGVPPYPAVAILMNLRDRGELPGW